MSGPRGAAARPWEHLIAAAIAVVVFGTAQLPWFWAWRADRLGHVPDRTFTGLVPSSADDACTYLAWIRQASEGRFFLTDRFTLEEHPRVYVNLFFAPLGWLAAATGMTPEDVYALARILLGIAVAVLLWRLARLAFDRPSARIVCYAFLMGSGGWEGLRNYFVRNHGWAPLSSPGWWMPEIGTFFSMMTLPHFLAGFVCMLLALFAMLRAWSPATEPRSRRLAYAAAAGVSVVVLTFFHPYDTVTMVAAFVLAPPLFGLAERRWPGREIAASAVALAVIAPSIVYNYVIFTFNPALRAMDVQGAMLTPEPSKIALSLGIGGVLSALASTGLTRMNRVQLTMLGWFWSVLVIIYLPIRFQRRMIGGIQFPMGVLATFAIVALVVPALAALAALVARARARPRGTGAPAAAGWAIVALAAVIVPFQIGTPWYVRDIEWRELRRYRHLSWMPKTEDLALKELDRLGPREAHVLSSYDFGLMIPARTSTRAFLGHYSLTIDCEAKKALVKRFFDASTDDAWRLDLLRRWKIRYVMWTEHERELGPFDPSGVPWLVRVFAAGEGTPKAAAIYLVRDAFAQPASSSPAP